MIRGGPTSAGTSASSSAALLDQFAELCALTGAAVVTDPVAAADAARGDDHGSLRRSIEARLMPGFRSLDLCPDAGQVWVRGGPFDAPTLRIARGAQWRRDRREGRPAPTHWAPCVPPTWIEEG